MAATTRLFYFLLVTLLCIVQFTQGIGDDISSKVDTDLFLEDEGSGTGMSGSGNGCTYDDDECGEESAVIPAKPTPRSENPYGVKGTGSGGEPGFTITDEPEGQTPKIFEPKNGSQASFFSQPGILAAIICGAIVGLLCAILLVMFIVYRMRKKDEGSYVLDDSKRTPTAYGKTKEFFA